MQLFKRSMAVKAHSLAQIRPGGWPPGPPLRGAAPQTPLNTWWVEKQDPVGVPLPTSDQKCGFNPISGVPTRPPDFFQESNSKASAGFCGIVTSQERPDWASPSLIVHMFFIKIKRIGDLLSEALGIFSRSQL
jgi:hypothetical protein